MTYGCIVGLCGCTVWQVLQHVKRSNAVYSVISHSFAKLIRYWVDQLNVFPVIIKHKHNMSSCLLDEMGLNCVSVYTLRKQESTQIWWLHNVINAIQTLERRLA